MANEDHTTGISSMGSPKVNKALTIQEEPENLNVFGKYIRDDTRT